MPGVPIRHNRSDRGNTGRSGGRLPVQPVVGPEQGVLGGGQHAYAGRIEGDRQDRPDQRVRRLLFPIETAVARREQTRVGAKQKVCRIQGVDGYCQGAPDGPALVGLEPGKTVIPAAEEAAPCAGVVGPPG